MTRPQPDHPRAVWAWLCNACGYDLDGLGADPHTCPECGVMTESFHAVPKYAPTTRSLRAMSWLVLLMAAGQIVNLAFYFFVWFVGSSVTDARMLLWTAIAGTLVMCLLLPGGVLIARADAPCRGTKQDNSPRQRGGDKTALLFDVETIVKRSDGLVAVMLIGLGIELAGIAYLTIEFDTTMGGNWIALLLVLGLIVEGYILVTGAATLLVQVVLKRLPRRRHRPLLDITRPLIIYGAWIAGPLMTCSFLMCVSLIHISWLWMAVTTLLSIVTCIFAHLTLRRTTQHGR